MPRVEFDVMNVISAQVDVHQAGDGVGFLAFVELDALHQRGGAVAHTDIPTRTFLLSAIILLSSLTCVLFTNVTRLCLWKDRTEYNLRPAILYIY